MVDDTHLIQFAPATADRGTIVGVAICSAAILGDPLFYDNDAGDQPGGSGDTLECPIANLDLQMSYSDGEGEPSSSALLQGEGSKNGAHPVKRRYHVNLTCPSWHPSYTITCHQSNMLGSSYHSSAVTLPGHSQCIQHSATKASPDELHP